MDEQIMSWLDVLPAVVIAVAVVTIPGLGVGWLLGARALTLCAAACPVSLGIIGTAAVLAEPVGLRWGLAPLTLAVGTAWGVSWMVGKRLTGAPDKQYPSREGSPTGLTTTLLWAGAALVLGAQIVYMIGSPGNIAQIHDNMFHLNAVRYVAESGNGSSLFLGHLGVDTLASFYPAAWHDTVALVGTTASVDGPVAINVTNLAVLCLAWPLGCMLLTGEVTRPDTIGHAIGAVLSTALSSFPYLFFYFGVVYPWMTAMALLPGLLAVILRAVKTAEGPVHDRGRRVALATAAASGPALTHTSVLVLALALAAPPVIAAGLARPSARSTARRVVPVVAYLGALGVIWMTVRPPRVPNWDDVGEPAAALVAATMAAPAGEPIPWVLVALSVLGLVALFRWPDQMWVFWLYALGVFFVVASHLRQLPDLRWWLTGVWYSDPYRAASIAAVTLLPLTALGAYVAIAWVRDRTTRWHFSSRPTAVAAVTLAVAAGFLLARTPAVTYSTEIGRGAHEYTATSRLLTSHELRLLERLPDYVPVGARVAGDPQTGAALSYAFAGRESVQPFIGLNRGPDGALVMDKLDDLRVDPSVCPAVRKLNVQFVLDFGDQAVDLGRTSRVAGLQDLTRENGFTLIAQEGPAKLYRITGCPSTTPG